MMKQYTDLFEAYYTGRAPDWLPRTDEPRFYLESMRRRLALVDLLRERYPLTVASAGSWGGEQWFPKVWSRFPDSLVSVQVVEDAIVESMRFALKGTSDIFRSIYTYEALLHIPEDELHCVIEVAPGPVHCTGSMSCDQPWVVASFPVDVTTLAVFIRYLIASGAPAAILAEAPIPRQPTTLAFIHDANGTRSIIPIRLSVEPSQAQTTALR